MNYHFYGLCGGMILLNAINIYRKFSEENAKHVFRWIVSALRYLYSIRISHGNSKLGNIISSNEIMIKIIYFGFASDSDIQIVYHGCIEHSAPDIALMISFDGKMMVCGLLVYAFMKWLLNICTFTRRALKMQCT